MNFELRPAAAADMPEIQCIYAHHVLHGTGTFEEAPPSVEEVTERWAAILRDGAGVVACDETGVLGYAYYGPFRTRSAYRYTAEDSVYVRDGAHGRGVGAAVLERLLENAAAAGVREMIAVIGDAENLGSLKLHERAGFEKVAHLRRVGFKFERWLDSVYMQRKLWQHAPDPSAERRRPWAKPSRQPASSTGRPRTLTRAA